ncbi:MAG: hypothetical protein AVO35_09010 [Candidatus Aegiribacteria sp. MLS_C]|nr:MAG: hypothetical protein AVO35_09010 [Candidatus Aegiribacteria sp. MLS_C]
MADKDGPVYVPAFIMEQYGNGMTGGALDCSVLVSDISGFTGLTESLFAMKKRGAELLSRKLNDMFEDMIDSVYRFRGFVVSFAGDAFTAVFLGDDGAAAAGAAELIRSRIPASVDTGAGVYPVGIKSGISAGRVLWNIYGSGPRAYLFSGSPVTEAAGAQTTAPSGGIILRGCSPGTFGSQVDRLSGEGSADGEPVRSKRCIDEIRAGFVHPECAAMADSPEFRDVASVFTRFRDIRDMNRFVDDIYRLSAEYGGYFDLLDCGDKGNLILTIFGAPRTAGRSVDRALGYALAMSELYGDSLSTGMTFGSVFAGFIGSPGSRGHYTVIGDRVNRAARLMEMASGGEILITQDTASMASEPFLFVPAEEEASHFENGSDSCLLVLGRTAGSSRPVFTGRFVGRTKELDSAERFLKETFDSGSMGAIVITGEAGIGKTRLAERLLTGAEDCRPVYLKCDGILSKSLNPIETFFGEVFGTAGLEKGRPSREAFERNFEKLMSAACPDEVSSYSRVELARLKFAVTGFLGIEETSEYQELDSRSRFDNTILGFLHLVRMLSAGKRPFLIVDDLQWVDPDTFSVLDDLFRQMDIDAPVICLLARPSCGPDPSCLLPEDARVLRIDLDPLPESEQIELLRNSLPCPPSNYLKRVITERAEGNPFYMEQMILYLLDRGLVDCSDGGAKLSAADTSLPGSIFEIIMSRIDSLETEVRRTVRHAAVLGRRFDVRVLSRMLIGSPVDLHLTTGVKSRIWESLSRLQYIFSHALIREAVYGVQMEASLSRMHLLAADVIEELFPGDARMYSDLSYHLERSGRTERMLKYTLLAAEYAYENYRNREALEMYGRYLQHQMDPSRCMDALLRKGEVHELLGEWETALSCFQQVIDWASGNGRRDMLAYATNRKGFIRHRTGNNEEALECFRRSEEIYRDIHDDLSLAKVYNNIGTVFIDRNELERARDYLRMALEVNEAHPELRSCIEGMVFGYNNLGLVYQKEGALEKAAECYRKSMVSAGSISSRRDLAALNFGNILYLQGNVDEAEKYYRIAMENAEKVGNRHVVRVLLNNLAAISAARGDFRKALDIYIEGLPLARSMNDRKGMRLLNQNIAEIMFFLGEYDEAEEGFLKAGKIAEEIGDERGMGSSSGKLGITALLRGHPERSLKHLHDGVEFSIRAGDTAYAHEFMFYLARALFRLGMMDELKETFDMMQELPAERIPGEQQWYTPVAGIMAACSSGFDSGVLGDALSIIRDFQGTEGEAIARLFLHRITGDGRELSRAGEIYMQLHRRNPISYYHLRIEEIAGGSPPIP